MRISDDEFDALTSQERLADDHQALPVSTVSWISGLRLKTAIAGSCSGHWERCKLQHRAKGGSGVPKYQALHLRRFGSVAMDLQIAEDTICGLDGLLRFIRLLESCRPKCSSKHHVATARSCELGARTEIGPIKAQNEATRRDLLGLPCQDAIDDVLVLLHLNGRGSCKQW